MFIIFEFEIEEKYLKNKGSMNRFIYSFTILIFSSLNLISQSDKDLELKKKEKESRKEIELINQKKKKLEDKIE